MKCKQFVYVLLIHLCTCAFSHAQVIRGIVYDADDATVLPFASVYLVEGEESRQTDSLGVFTLRAPALPLVHLRFVALGYETVIISAECPIDSLVVRLIPKHLDLHEVTVSGALSQSQSENPFHIESRKLSELTAIHTMNLSEAIARIPGVYQTSTGNGISKPVVRGMQGMRVVTVWNGMRVENQQWGGDHGLGISDVGLGSLEVIKGPASLLYGADAIGGVIYLNDLPHAAVNTRIVEAKTTADANTAGISQRMVYREAWEKMRMQLGASYSSHADYQLPNGRYAANTRFSEAAVKSVFSFNGKRSVHNMRYSFSQSMPGIPGESDDSIVTPETFMSITQIRRRGLPMQSVTNQLASFENKWFSAHSELQLLTGFSSNRLMELEDDVQVPSMQMTLSNALYSMKWIRRLLEDKMRLIAGMQGMHQWNINAPGAPERLIPDSRTFDQGAYLTGQLGDKAWNVQAGVRYDVRSLNASTSDSTTFTRTYSGYNVSVGGVYHRDFATFRAALSTGYRAPHLTELLSEGFHHSALRYEQGDASLRPEYARQVDVTAEFTGEHVVLVYNPFANAVRNYIALQPLGFAVEGMPAYRYQSLSEVVYYGNDVGLHYHPHFAHDFHVEATWTYIDVKAPADSSVALLPPQRLQTTLRYSFEGKRKFRITELNVMHTFLEAQRVVAYMETPSAAYHVLDAAAAFAFARSANWELRIGVRNLLNERYIDHLSRLKNIQMPMPGRNIYASLQYTFGS